MPDVSHATADKDFIDVIPCDLGKQPGVIGIIGCTDDRFGDLRQIDLNDGGVLGVSVGGEQGRIFEPGLHAACSALQGPRIPIALGNHGSQKDNIRAQILGNGCFA